MLPDGSPPRRGCPATSPTRSATPPTCPMAMRSSTSSSCTRSVADNTFFGASNYYTLSDTATGIGVSTPPGWIARRHLDDRTAPDRARPRPADLAAAVHGTAPDPVATRPGDDRRHHPRRHHRRPRQPHPGRRPTPLRPGRAVDGRLHLLRAGPPGPRPGGAAGPAGHHGSPRHPRAD